MDYITPTCDRGWPLAQAFLRSVDIGALADALPSSFLRRDDEIYRVNLTPGEVVDVKGGGKMRRLDASRPTPRFLSRLIELRAFASAEVCAWGDFVFWMGRLTAEEMEFLVNALPPDVLTPFVDAHNLVHALIKDSTLHVN